jgi:ketol-acid reductoisomerase
MTMKTPPRYIEQNASQFLECMDLIRAGLYSHAILLAKSTGNRRLTQRIQQKVDTKIQ